MVMQGGTPRPVIAAGQDGLVVDQGKFMMHVVRRRIGTDVDPGISHARNVGTEVEGFVIVGDDFEGYALSVFVQDDLGDMVVADGEDADLDDIAGGLELGLDDGAAIVARREIDPALVLGLGWFQQRLVRFFEPVDEAFGCMRIGFRSGQVENLASKPVAFALVEPVRLQQVGQMSALGSGKDLIGQGFFKRLEELIH